MSLMPDLIRGRDAIAAELDMSPATVSRLARDERLPIFFIGGTLCARRSHLLAAIEAEADRALERVTDHATRAAQRRARGLSRPSDPRPRALVA
jgi:hypothetical protein